MEISLQGYNNKYVTMRVKSGANVGDSMDIVENNTSATAADQKAPIGKLVSQNGEYGLIQTTGAMEFKYSDKPELGYTAISSDGKGGIKPDDNGRFVIVTEINEIENTALIVM